MPTYPEEDEDSMEQDVSLLRAREVANTFGCRLYSFNEVGPIALFSHQNVLKQSHMTPFGDYHILNRFLVERN